MANYPILRIEKRKIGSVTAICNHHERLKEKYQSNPDIDHERTHLNYHIVKPEEKYRPLVQKRIEEVGAKQRKNSIVMQDAFVSATPDWLKAKSDDEQRKFLEYAYDFFKERYGEENIISAVVHLDERTPHMHLVFVPITKDGRLSSKDIMGGPAGMRKLQDDFYAHMSEKYPDLTRGISKTITHREHIPTYMYKNVAELDKKYDDLVAAVSDIGIVGNAKKRDDALVLLGQYAPEMAQMKTQLSSTEKYIEGLEQKISAKEGQVAIRDHKINDQNVELFQTRSEVRSLEVKLKKLVKLTEKIPLDVMTQITEQEKERRRSER